MQEYLYYLADRHDRNRLSVDDRIEPAHECMPQYFPNADAAYAHPLSEGLMVHIVRAVETLPGAGVGATLDDAVHAGDVYKAVAAMVAVLCAS